MARSSSEPTGRPVLHARVTGPLVGYFVVSGTATGAGRALSDTGQFGVVADCQVDTKERRHVHRVIEVVGSSTVDIDDTISRAVTRAAETARHQERFERVNVHGHIDDRVAVNTQVLSRATTTDTLLLAAEPG